MKAARYWHTLRHLKPGSFTGEFGSGCIGHALAARGPIGRCGCRKGLGKTRLGGQLVCGATAIQVLESHAYAACPGRLE
jgi:hypothetical protein